MGFFLKFLVSFPLFFFFCFKLFWKVWKKRKKGVFWNEEKHYRWVKKYSWYLLWIFSKKFSIKNIEFWNEKGGLVFVETANQFIPLFLIRKNNFDKQSPISLLFSEDYKNKINFLIRNFYSLINPIILNSNSQELTKQISENVKVPRTMFYFFSNFEEQNIEFVIEMARGSFVKIISTSIKNDTKPKEIILTKTVEPENLIKLEQKFVKKIIQNLN